MKIKTSHKLSIGAEIVEEQNMNKVGTFISDFFDKFRNHGTIAVLRLQGVIGKVGLKGGLTIESLNDSIEKAFKTPKLKALCLIINSPGGSPVQSELIAQRITSLAEKNEIPVYSFVEDVAASGGYWLACAGSEIYASKSSIIGSIGVISSGFGFHEAIEKIGVERRIYTQGNNKSILDPFTKAKESDVRIIKNMQKYIHDHFIDYVKTKRRRKLSQTDDILFNGEFWTGEVAAEFGLIDGISDLYSFAREKFGDKVKIEYITPKKSWMKQKLGIESPKDLASEIVDEVITKASEYSAYSKFGL